MIYIIYHVSVDQLSLWFATYHVTVELSGGVAAGTGPVGLGGGLWHVRLDQTSPVNQTGTHKDSESLHS